MRLYRGIAVPAHQLEAVVLDIKSNGILDGFKTKWNMRQLGHVTDIKALHKKPDLSTKETGPENSSENAVCACGDGEGEYITQLSITLIEKITNQ